MRKSCLDCARKHVAEAEVLAREALLGYPMHSWLAIGHLAQAEAETVDLYPQYATVIRIHRLAYPDVPFPTIELLEMLSEVVSDVSQEDPSGDGILPDTLGAIGPTDQGRDSDELQETSEYKVGTTDFGGVPLSREARIVAEKNVDDLLFLLWKKKLIDSQHKRDIGVYMMRHLYGQ